MYFLNYPPPGEEENVIAKVTIVYIGFGSRKTITYEVGF